MSLKNVMVAQSRVARTVAINASLAGVTVESWHLIRMRLSRNL